VVYCSLNVSHLTCSYVPTGAPPEVPAVYGDLSRAAANVLKRLSESGVSNSTAPDADELQLEWVHGYRGFDCRNNVFYVEPRKATAAGSGAILL
jgi:hypothetical protein